MGELYGLSTRGIVLAVCLSFAGEAHAACTAPPPLDAKLRAHPTVENAIAVGNWFATHQQFGCAVESFRGALKSDPNSAQLHYLEGLALSAWGHPTEAVSTLQEAVRLDPKVIKPHLVLASVLEQTGRPAEAEEQWKIALGIDPHSIPALEGLSTSLLARQDYIGVAGLLRNAPRTETLTLNLVRALGQLNLLDAAGEALAEAIKLAPRSLRLANAQSVLLVKERRYQEAVKLLAETVQQHPGNEDAELLYFRILVLTGDIEHARPLGRKLLAQLPHSADVLYLNGVVDRSVGEYAQSKAHLEEAVKIEPNFANSRFNLGIVLVFLKEWPEAKEQLEKAIELGAIEPQAHFELSKALRALGDTQRATEEMQRYQQLKKSEDDAIQAASKSAQGDAELQAGNIQEAITHFREATEADPNNGSYRYKLSIALDRTGDTEGERAQLEEAVKLDPKLAGAHNQLGYLLSRKGDASGAEEHFRMATQFAPGWTEAWINFAATLAGESHFHEAREAVAVALRLEPDNAEARELSDQLARDPAGQQSHP